MKALGAETSSAPSAWDDSCLAIRLFARDPAGLGGIWVRSRAGPVRDRWLSLLREALPADTPVIRLPSHAGDERLLGGLDLAATLAAGRPVAEHGLLAAANGGLVVMPMAERSRPGLVARMNAAFDSGVAVVERDGLALRSPARFGIVALDEGIEADERPPEALTDRLAFRVDLNEVGPREALAPIAAGPSRQGPAAGGPGEDAILEALCGAAVALGIGSLRAPLLAVKAARAAAALGGRREASTEDAALAARLVLAPRALRSPPLETPPEAQPPSDPPSPSDTDDQGADDREISEPPSIDDLVLAAAVAALPPGLLRALRTDAPRRGAGAGSGAESRALNRGRPTGTLRGDPRGGARLNLIETLRAAAPWQALRGRSRDRDRLVVTKDDLRITRFKRRVETTTVFVVDASGSSALNRLAEAKGAVELLLAECYVRRDRVALISFRRDSAELVLPPTRSLTRTKRSLAALPGGGGTPLATAIDAAAALATSISRSGGSPVLVFLTDGRANIARGGFAGREAAGKDALAAARLLRQSGATSLFVDISPRASEAAATVAREMGAAYLPLPVANAAVLSEAVRRETAASSGSRR